jgi:hypothetical protein
MDYTDESSLPVGRSDQLLETLKVTDDDGVVSHREGVFSGGLVDLLNTSTTALTTSDTFTGTFVRCPDGVTVSCKTDQPGTLYFDFSNDATNVDTFPVSGFKIAAGIHEYHNAKVNGRYFRVRLVNDDDGAQTYLRLYSYFGPFFNGNAPLNQSIGLDTDAQITRPSDMQEEISLGRRSGVTAWAKFGHRSLLAGGGAETVWDTTGNYTPPATATAMRIAYDGTGGGTTDGADTTGARVLRIWHIDSAGLPAVLDHTLGTDGSDDTTETTLGINRVAIIGAGTLGYNASAITVTAVTGGAKLAVVPAADGITQQAFFHVGSNHDALFKFLFIHMNKASGGAATVEFKGHVYNRTLGTTAEVFRITLDDSVEVSATLSPQVPFAVPATGVLYFTANTTRDGAEAVVRFSGNEYQRT